MVGVRRSKGCALCIKRRVKCDEARPACERCEKYGVQCPGYNRGLKFVVGAPRRARRRPPDATLPDDSSKPEPPSSKSNNVLSKSPGTTLVANPKLRAATIPGMIHSLSLERVQCLSLVISDLSTTASTEIMFASHWLSSIPERLGISDALDKATHCFVIHYMGLTHHNEQMTRYARVTYGQALCSLQKALYDPVQVATSETLCAASLLCLYEMFAYTKPDSWIAHADGIGRMIKMRGPENHRSGFDNCIFVAFRGTIIMGSLFRGEDCFLDTEEWHGVAAEHRAINISPSLSQLFDEFSRYLSAIPGLVWRGYAVSRLSVAQVSSLVQRILYLRNQFQDWFDRLTTFLPLPTQVPSSFKDGLFPIVYHYSSVTAAVVFVSYYASMIVLYEVLKACHYDADYHAETVELRDKICMSIEYVYKAGVMGVYRLGYAIRIAFEVASPEMRVWIKGWLGRFAGVYKMMSPEGYPEFEQEVENVVG